MRGPAPSDVKFTCPDCGKVRFYHPSHRRTFMSARCNSCAQRHRHQIRKAQMKTINTLSFAESYKVADAIRAATEPDGEKFVRYIGGATDATMAAAATSALGRKVTEHNVTAIRRQVVGTLRKNTTPPTRLGGGLKAEVAALRAEVAELRALVAPRPTAYRNGVNAAV